MVTVNIQTDSRYKFDHERLRNCLVEVLARYKLTEKVVVDVTMVGKRKMSQLHQDYMKLQGPTDVISFPQNDSSDGRPFVGSPEGELQLGDIVICYPVAIEEAIEKQVKVDNQLRYLAEHGLMHLLGYHHE